MEDVLGCQSFQRCLKEFRVEIVNAAVDSTASGQSWLYPPSTAIGYSQNTTVGAGQDGINVSDGVSVMVGALFFVLVQSDGIAVS